MSMKFPTIRLEVAILAAVQALDAGSCSTSGALVVGLTFSLVAFVLPFTLGGIFTLTFPFGFSFVLPFFKPIYLHRCQTSIT